MGDKGTAKLGSYVLGEKLGAGAMGIVYRATTDGADGPYAVKVLRPELSEDDRTVATFLREKRIFNRIDHPNVVKVHDLVAEGDQLGIVMEFVGGGDLRQLIDEQRLAPSMAVDFAGQMVAGLEAIHGVDVIHRDLKPANVLRAGDDGVSGTAAQLKISDFGISRLADEAMSRTSATVGTPLYMAPEATEGGGVGPPADVYALGAILFEMLAGRPPFPPGNGTMALIRAHVEQPPPRLLDVPVNLSSVVDQMLAKNPADRPSLPVIRQRLQAVTAEIDDRVLPTVGEPVAVAVGPGQPNAGTVSAPMHFPPPAPSPGSGPQPVVGSPPVVGGVASGPQPIAGPAGVGGGATVGPVGDAAATGDGATPATAEPPSSVGRSGQRLWLIAAAVVLAVAAIGALTVAVTGGDDAETTEVAAADVLDITFEPFVRTDDLLVSREWLYDPDERLLRSETLLINVGSEPLDADHWELIPSGLGRPLDEIEFRSTPGELDPVAMAAAFELRGLEPGARRTTGYEVVLDDGRDWTSQLALVAGSLTEAEGEFLADREIDRGEVAFVGVEIQPDAVTAVAGGPDVALSVIGRPDGSPDETVAIPPDQAAWSTADPAVAVIDEVGRLRPIGPGATTAEVDIDGMTASIPVAVSTPATDEVAGPDQVSPEADYGAGGTAEPERTNPTPSSTTQPPPTSTTTTSTTTTTTTTPVVVSALTICCWGVDIDTGPAGPTARVTFRASNCATARWNWIGGESFDSPGWPDPGVNCWIDHGRTFTGLAYDTTYNVGVELVDVHGQSATGSHGFITPEDPDVTVPPPSPVISNWQAEVTDTTARVTFTASHCTTSRWIGTEGEPYLSPGWPDASVNCWERHGRTFTGLTPGTTYTVSVELRDLSGQPGSGSHSFTTSGG